MIDMNEQFITDTKGHKSAVIIPFIVYQKIIDVLEDAEDLLDFKKLMSEKTVSYDKYRQQRINKIKHVRVDS